MKWLLVALACIVAVAVPLRPDIFAVHTVMRFMPEDMWEAPSEHAECVHSQIEHQLPASICAGATTM